MLPISNGAVSGQNTSTSQQFFTPIYHQNVSNSDFATASGSFLTPGAFNGNENWNQVGNEPQAYDNFSSAGMNSYSKSFNMASSLDPETHHTGNAPYKHQYQHQHQQQYQQQQYQQQYSAPLNLTLAHDFADPLPTNANDLLQVVNWLDDDTFCTPISGSNNSNNNSISFQELVSWPPLGPSLAPKFNNSVDNGNINMTNLYHDLNHFTI